MNAGITTYSEATPCSLAKIPTLRETLSPNCTTLKLETTFYLKMLVSMYQTTRRHSPYHHNISPNTHAYVLLWTSEIRLAQRVAVLETYGGWQKNSWTRSNREMWVYVICISGSCDCTTITPIQHRHSGKTSEFFHICHSSNLLLRTGVPQHRKKNPMCTGNGL